MLTTAKIKTSARHAKQVPLPDNLQCAPVLLLLLLHVSHCLQFNKLVAAAGAVGAFEKYVRQHGGPACGALVELLVNSGADVDAKVVSEGVDLNGLRALHILARWSNDAGE